MTHNTKVSGQRAHSDMTARIVGMTTQVIWPKARSHEQLTDRCLQCCCLAQNHCSVNASTGTSAIKAHSSVKSVPEWWLTNFSLSSFFVQRPPLCAWYGAAIACIVAAVHVRSAAPRHGDGPSTTGRLWSNGFQHLGFKIRANSSHVSMFALVMLLHSVKTLLLMVCSPGNGMERTEYG